MKKFLFILFLFSRSLAQAQVVFCPPGAEWHYSFIVYMPVVYQNEQVKYVRDSIIDSETVKVLHHNKFYLGYNLFPGNNLTLIKQKGDTIFFRNQITQHTWQILYNFAALPGQSWQTTILLLDAVSPKVDTFTISVLSVSTTVVNNFTLKTMSVMFDNDQATITERFGSDFFMFSYTNDIASDGDILNKFLCYKDDKFGLKQFTQYSCNYATGIESHSATNTQINIYPNPASGKLHWAFENNLAAAEVKIYNTLGQMVFNRENVFSQGELDISRFPNGIYYLNVKNGTGACTTKFVKQ